MLKFEKNEVHCLSLLSHFFLLLWMAAYVQSVPVFDANGPEVEGINFTTMFIEETHRNISILSPEAFITDDAQNSNLRIDLITVELKNALRPISREFLYLPQLPPSVLSIEGNGTRQINITAIDPTNTTVTVVIFETTLRSIRYNNNAPEPGNVNREVFFTVFDGLYVNSPLAKTTIDIQTIDDVPLADLNGNNNPGVNGRHEYIESSPPIFILSMLSLIDADSRNSITGAQIRIDDIFDAGNESIALNSSLLPSGVICQPVSCNGTDIQITGTSSISVYENLLATLQYVNLQQSVDLPNLRDRVIFVTVSDGVSTSDSDANILIDFIPANPRVIIKLAAPNQNFETTFEEDQLTPIPCTSNVRVVDTSIQTLESIVVSIRDNLPAGMEEDLEMITVASVTGLNISIENNTVLKRITFSQVATVSQYVDAIQRVRYFNGENEPYQINRFVDFLVIPGGGAPNDTAFCNITLIQNTAATLATVATTTQGHTSQNCEPSSSIFRLCKDPDTLAKNLANVTINSSLIQQPDGLLDLITVVEYLTPLAIAQQNTELREIFLDTVDNLINVDSEVIGQSQNASKRLLAILVDFADNLQLPNDTNSTTYVRTSFTIQISDIDPNQYTGEIFTINSVPVEGSVDSSSTTLRIEPAASPENFQNTSQTQNNMTAKVKIPPTIFEDGLGVNASSNGSSLQRVTVSLFTLESLFQSSKFNGSLLSLSERNISLGSIVLGVRVNASNEDTKLSTPIEVHFQLNNVLTNDTLLCALWQGSQEEWSSDSCTLVIHNELETAVAKYHQMGHFALLLAVKEDPLPTAYSITLYTVTIVGLALSLLCLVLFLITFSTLRKFRGTDHGGILANMCIALICVYVVYLIAAHASSVRVLCITAAALLQYFFLVFFGWTTAEAVYLYRNLVVKVLGVKLHRYALKAGIVVWLAPLVIVAVSIGPGFDFYYTDDYSFCRARGLPFWLGFILPFLILYVLNWILFFLIVLSLCRRTHKGSQNKLLKENVIIAIGLAVLFGFGWGFGLAVSSTGNATVTFVLQLLFVIFVGCQGILILALHGIKRSDFRKQWKSWFYKVTRCRKSHPMTKLPVGSTMGGLNSRSTHHAVLDSQKPCTSSFDELDNTPPQGEDTYDTSESSPPGHKSYEF